MEGMLEMSHQELKITMINMLRALMKKVGNTQEQTGNISTEMEILRRNQKVLEIKNTVREMKNAFNGFISRVDTVEERISGLEDMPKETSKLKCREKKKKDSKSREYPRTEGQITLHFGSNSILTIISICQEAKHK